MFLKTLTEANEKKWNQIENVVVNLTFRGMPVFH